MAWTDTARRQHMRKGRRDPSDLRKRIGQAQKLIAQIQYFSGADGGTRTRTPRGRGILSPVRLPISPRPRRPCEAHGRAVVKPKNYAMLNVRRSNAGAFPCRA